MLLSKKRPKCISPVKSPFSKPLAKYLDRYQDEGVQFFIDNLHLPRHLRTLRSILQAQLALNAQHVLASHTNTILAICIHSNDCIIPALSLFADLAELDHCWILDHANVMELLLALWDTGMQQPEREVIQRHNLMMSIFCSALKASPRIDLIFALIAIYTRNLKIDMVQTIHFLYQHVALSSDTIFHILYLLYRIPHAARPAQQNSSKQHLLDTSFIDHLHSLIWRRILEGNPFTETDDMFKIELLLLTTILVQHFPSLVSHLPKDILKCAWHFVGSSNDPIMKETAFLLNARFFVVFEPALRQSDLTARLEPLFFVRCRSTDFSLRECFLDLLDVSVPWSLFSRLMYIYAVQSWESVANHNWLHIALHLFLGAANQDVTLSHERRPVISAVFRPKAQDLVCPMLRLVSATPQGTHDMWVSVFPAAWACLSWREQGNLTQYMINLLSREYHIKQAEMRPNVIQTLLTGLHACVPPVVHPPHLIKYLAKTYGAWYISLEILTDSLEYLKDDKLTLQDNVLDSLADMYSEIAEDDMFYGLW
ncbi:hypothetical protein C8R42DRAFT_729730 [Lentinula raphanica]|nr:hypothetical protein C8R42DRAFT_729730 [Lentinula raphanica]